MSLEFDLFLYVSLVEVLALVAALVLVILAFNGYRKSKSTSMLAAATGFGMLGIASLAEGVFYTVFGYSLIEAQAVRSTLTVVGLVILVYSIHRTR
ncbi:MAG: hypothetical protein JRN20_07620 [Nitrososphaerota archaeon]|nr:hypothetical protein [Nitrososphaerota archaeon]